MLHPPETASGQCRLLCVVRHCDISSRQGFRVWKSQCRTSWKGSKQAWEDSAHDLAFIAFRDLGRTVVMLCLFLFSFLFFFFLQDFRYESIFEEKLFPFRSFMSAFLAEKFALPRTPQAVFKIINPAVLWRRINMYKGSIASTGSGVIRTMTNHCYLRLAEISLKWARLGIHKYTNTTASVYVHVGWTIWTTCIHIPSLVQMIPNEN